VLFLYTVYKKYTILCAVLVYTATFLTIIYIYNEIDAYANTCGLEHGTVPYRRNITT